MKIIVDGSNVAYYGQQPNEETGKVTPSLKTLKVAINTLKNNLNNINNYEIICDDYKCALNKLKMKKFDIIFLDPPYKLNLINDCVDFIFKNDMLNMDGIIVCEAENEELNDLYNVIKDKKYGSKRIRIYKK